MCSLSPKADCDVFKGQLRYEGVDVQFALSPIEFRWWPEESPDEVGVKITTADMISVTSAENGAPGGGMLQISFVEQRNWIDLTRTIAMFYGEIVVCRACAARLQKHINKLDGRPRRALVVISPVSGLCKGKQLYEKKVAPLFKEAGVQTDVKVTEGARHAVEIVSQYELTSVDSVVVVGGDGMYSEIVNGLLRNPKYSRADDVIEPRAVDIPIGIIPSGTGNIIALHCYGSKDIDTAALSIIMGRRRRTGVFGVYSENKLVTYAGFVVTYGFYSDLMQLVTSRRCRNSLLNIPILIYTMLEFVLFSEIRELDVTVKFAQSIESKTVHTHGRPHSRMKPTLSDKSAPKINTNTSDSETCAKTSLNARVQDCGFRPTELSRTNKQDIGRIIQVLCNNNNTMLEFVLFSEIRELDVTVKFAQSIESKTVHTHGRPHSRMKPTLSDKSAPKINTNTSDSETCAKTSLNARVQECGFRPTELSRTDKQDNHTNRLSWDVTTGSYTEVMSMFPFDMFAFQESDGMQAGTATRLLLYKPTSVWQFLKSVYHGIVKDNDSLSGDENVEHVLVSEYSVKLNKQSDPNTDNGKKELVLNIDGDVVNLRVPEFHVRLFDQKLELFCNE